MSDIVSVFSGVKPIPIGEADWREVLNRIASGKYKDVIERGRLIQNMAEYRTFKTKLPSVTFCSNFLKRRNSKNVLNPTGFIIPDLDHLDDMEKTFDLLSKDENVWFCFRSPSGDGLKCGIRASGIKSDDDIKRFFDAVSRYFILTYGIKIDPACKDIARLTFISNDPDLFINTEPSYFQIDKWKELKQECFYQPYDTNNGWKAKYGNRVLESCCLKIRESVVGEQHYVRLRQSKLVGGFIASGFIDEQIALSSLELAVKESGAKKLHQAMSTISDGIEHGKKYPIHPEPRLKKHKNSEDIEFYCDIDECFEESKLTTLTTVDDIDDIDDKRRQLTTVDDTLTTVGSFLTTVDDSWRHLDDSLTTLDDTKNEKNDSKKAQNLAVLIKEYITNSSGSFTTDQVDREFCLTTREDKKNRSKILSRCLEKKLIILDKRIKGKYNIVDSSLSLIDIFNTDETNFEIKMPFDIHSYVSIPKKAIIVIAGTFNAGKTAILLNIMKLNLSQQYKRLYLMSEMGNGEYVRRLRQFSDVDFNEWKKVMAAERSYDFNGAIQHHNPNGLTCIDFLEEVEGEYFKIPTDIRNVYDSLGDGVAVIAIQKKTDTDYARGGQATAEKARLYMAVDFMAVDGQSIICALKVIKVKQYIGTNIQGHEIHFRISDGSVIEPLCEWTRCSEVDRKKCIDRYLQPEDYKKRAVNYVFEFKTKTGRLVGINKKTIVDWEKHFKNINVMDELEDICEDTFRRSWLDDKSYFFQISGLLSKRNDMKT